MKNWKTTAAGILSAFLGTVPPATAFLAAYQTIEANLPGHSHADYRLAIAGAALSCAAAIARAWVGLIENDAPPPPPPPIVPGQNLEYRPGVTVKQ
jgi:hypothetical protein